MHFGKKTQPWLTGGRNLSWPNFHLLIAKKLFPNIWISIAIFVVAATLNKFWPNVSISGDSKLGDKWL